MRPTKLFAAALIIQGQLEIAFAMLDDEKVARAAEQASGDSRSRATWARRAWSHARSGILAYYAGRRHDIDLAVQLGRRVHRRRAPFRSERLGDLRSRSLAQSADESATCSSRPKRARKVIEEVKAIWTATGYSSGLAAIGSRAAAEALGRGDIELAVREWRDAMNVLEENGAAWWARSPRINLAIGLGALGQFEEAAPLLRRSLRDARRAGFRTDVGPARRTGRCPRRVRG